jgi:catechol 2,3-dioxygenase-like lactoylglutathione lyase family enzyme
MNLRLGHHRGDTATFTPVIKGFSHVQLVVSDIDVSVHWYGIVLGMELMSRGSFSGGDYAALRSPTGRFVIGLQTGVSESSSGSSSADSPTMIDHLSFAVEDRSELERHRDAIAATGIEAGPLIEEAASWNFRFRDPDGLLVELTAAK